MARVIDPATGQDVRYCAEGGEDMIAEGTMCPNAHDLCIDHCGESH